jgi:hypothetical protein
MRSTISIMEVAPGTEGKTWTEIERGSPSVIPGMGVTMQPGVLYETQYVSDNPITESIAWLNAQIGAVLAAFAGVQTEYIIVEGNVLRHGYSVPADAAERGLALPLIGGIITAVIVVLAVIGIILIIVGMWMGKDPMELLMELVPGMVVTVAGGAVMGALPGKAKVAGLIPLGIGLFLLLKPFIPGEEEEPPTTCAGYTTEQECVENGCYWYDGSCHSAPQPGAEAEIIRMTTS